MQAEVAEVADLPDAPQGNYCASQLGISGTGSLAGTVVDSNYNPLSGAQVHLERAGSSASCDLATERDGGFLFADLPKGVFRLRVSFSGMQTVVDEQIMLQNGERLTLPDLTVHLATTTQQVTVTVSQAELAQEEVKTQEKQRALLIFPNFYSSYIWNAAPLNPRQKFDLALHSIFDPVNFLVVGAEAGGLQYNDTYHYGTGAEAYAKYYGSTFADTATTRILGGAVLPSLLHQDPRYFYKGRGRAASRALYAVTRAVITRNDAGRNEPNYSAVAGGLMAGAISNAYHPETDRGAGLTLRNGAIAIGGHAFDNLVREFILRPITSHVPESGVGQPPLK
jgi:hypothetical protein